MLASSAQTCGQHTVLLHSNARVLCVPFGVIVGILIQKYKSPVQDTEISIASQNSVDKYLMQVDSLAETSSSAV
jgi:hypothetical protein